MSTTRMHEITHQQCEWAINDDREVMLAVPRFHQSSLDAVILDGNDLIIRYDWFLRVKVRIPKVLFPCVSEASSILLVAFSSDGDITEKDLPVSWPATP